ncbi:MAG: hypothetical protein AB1758_34555, partial [Candidatus Eremiobacterota bacterium]
KAAVEQAGIPAQVARIEPPTPVEEAVALDPALGPVADLGQDLLAAAGDRALQSSLAQVLSECQGVPLQEAAARAVVTVPESRPGKRAEVGRAGLKHLKHDVALKMVDGLPSDQSKANVALAALQGADLPGMLASMEGADKGRASKVALDAIAPQYPEHARVGRAMSGAASDDVPRGALVEGFVAATLSGANLESAVLAGLDAAPADYPGNLSAMAQAAVRVLPRLSLTRTAVSASSDDTCKNAMIRTALKAAQEDRAPGPLAVELLASIPSSFPGNRHQVSMALLRALRGDAQVSPWVGLADSLVREASDEGVQTGLVDYVLRAGLRGDSLPQTALGAIQNIPTDYPGNRAAVSRGAVQALEGDPQVGGYCQLGRRLIRALSDETLGTNMAISVLESGLAGRTLVDTARAAIDTIPSDYPGNRCAVALAILNELADGPEVAMARQMVRACSDDGCKTAVSLAVLKVVSAGVEQPLALTAKALLEALPQDYPGNRHAAGQALLKEMRAHFGDPDASSVIDGALLRMQNGNAAPAVEALQQLVVMKSTRQQVEELHAAVTGEAGVGGVEERGQVVIIGGVRVKVKKQ